MDNEPTPTTPVEPTPSDIDALADSLALTDDKRLTYFLYDLGSGFMDAARELKETGEVEPGQLKHLARRALAAYLATIEPIGIYRNQISPKLEEMLRNPHRVKGVEMP